MRQRGQRDGSEEHLLTDAAVAQKMHSDDKHDHAVVPLHRPGLPWRAVGACCDYGTSCRAGIAS
jgi:hypothetical protein